MKRKNGFTLIEVLVVIAIIGLGVVAIFTVGCDDVRNKPTADQRQAAKTRESLAEADRQIGMPAIKNFQERKLAKTIFELRDRTDLVTYAYIVNHMTGDLVYIGQCVGFGLPYSVQYTNPEKLIQADLGQYNGTMSIPQADPNGLFMPEGLSATWLMMLDPVTKDVKPVYVEPAIIVSPFKLH